MSKKARYYAEEFKKKIVKLSKLCKNQYNWQMSMECKKKQ